MHPEILFSHSSELIARKTNKNLKELTASDGKVVAAECAYTRSGHLTPAGWHCLTNKHTFELHVGLIFVYVRIHGEHCKPAGHRTCPSGTVSSSRLCFAYSITRYACFTHEIITLEQKWNILTLLLSSR